eukprot:XP_011662138.1 PREDICTED: hyalin-like [Strongylocentrotus purpuratus]
MCTFFVIVDNEKPVIDVCPSDQSVTTDSGVSIAVVTWTPPTATDNFGVPTLTSTPNSGDTFPIGNNTVTYTATDDAGNTETCTFFVIVDNEKPVIDVCPSDQSVTTDSGVSIAVVTWTPPTATDNFGVPTLTSTPNSGDTFPIGNNTVTYTATDDAGNTETCTFFVIVDNEKPVIDVCPSDQSVTTDSGVSIAVVTWTPPTATDNFGVPTLTSTPNSGDTFPIGNNTVTYTATDDAGNTETCTFFVIVDNEKPVIDVCPSDQSVTTDSGVSIAVVTWTPPTATDNFGVPTLTSTPNSGDTFPIGNNTVTYTATDDAGNTETCTFFVIVDNEKPVIDVCPSDQSVNTDSGVSIAVVTWTPPTATDNFGVPTLTSTPNSGDTFPIGNNTVTYTATDDAGNTETCTFFVIVDNEKPVIDVCPSDQSVTTDSGVSIAVVTWTPPTATDNFGVPTLTSTPNSGDTFPIGNNTVTYTATDDAGNTETCTFFVIVDNEKPVIDVCPSDQSVTTDSGVSIAVVTWTPPTATDNFGVPTLTSTPNSGDTFPIGNNTVTYTATDDAGNTETCTFFVIVDNEKPVIDVCPSDQSVTTDSGVSIAVVTWTPPTATDNFGVPTLTSTPNSGDTFPIGKNTVTYTATDDAGNTETCTFFVIVDNEKPVIDVCPSDQSVTTDSGVSIAVVTWTPPTATDNFGVPTLTSTPNSGDTFPIGNNTVTYTATDDAGNTETCTFFVIVDNEKPVFNLCPSDLDVTTDIGYPTAVVNWTPPTATDNSGIQTLTSTHNSGENFTFGNNTVTYTATDDAGNTETCTFFVIVSDNEKPVFDLCPSDQDVTTDIGYPTALVNWTQPTATDNSGIQTLTSTHNSGENFTIGNNTVTYTATDDAGNTETCTFVVIVSDNEKPVFDLCPGDQDVTTDIGYPTAVVNWTQPTATDNSGIQTLTSTHNSGENFTIGNNTVTYTATDDAGNTETCTFVVIVSDTDECSASPSVCDSDNGVCMNSAGSYSCLCSPGYELSDDNITCNDTDECSAVPSVCDSDNGVCMNSVGSYNCSCSSGYELSNDNITCNGKDVMLNKCHV